MNGSFITFEGIDGCGKSTQARWLVSALRERGLSVVHTREPGGTELGREIRRLFLHFGRLEIGAATEALLMAADRSDHVERVIRPALVRGEIVISERYTDSTEAYQGYGGSMPIDAIQAINDVATQRLEPTLTFLLDLDPYEASRRRSDRSDHSDRMEAKAIAFHERVREGYLEIGRRHRDRIVLIDASLPAPEVHVSVMSALVNRGIVPPERGEGE